MVVNMAALATAEPPARRPHQLPRPSEAHTRVNAFGHSGPKVFGERGGMVEVVGKLPRASQSTLEDVMAARDRGDFAPW